MIDYRKNSYRIAPKDLFIAFFMTISLIGFSGMLRIFGIADVEDELDRQLKVNLYSFTFLISGLIIIARWKVMKVLIANNPWLIALMLFGILSISWSTIKLVSTIRVVQLCGVIFTGTAFSGIHKRDDYWLVPTLKLITVLCLCAIAFYMALFPYDSIDHTLDDRFRGPYDTPNVLAQTLVLTLAVWLPSFKFGKISAKVGAFLAIVVALFFLVLSGSKTGLVVCMVIIMLDIVFLFPKFLRNLIVFGIPGLIILIQLGWFIFFNESFLSTMIGLVFNMLGRESDLTGRIPMWIMLFEKIMSEGRILYGYGYGGFWENNIGPSADVVRALGWLPVQAHDGYIDIVLQFGLVGLALFVPFIVALYRNAVKYIAMNVQEGIVIINILIMITILNISESSFIRTASPYWFLLVIMAINVTYKLKGTSETATIVPHTVNPGLDARDPARATPLG